MTDIPRVALHSCQSYSEGLQQAVTDLLEPLGGFAAYVSPGQRVLIKPNLLTDRRPELAVTTHPQVVRAVIRNIRACGASPIVADSPASSAKLHRVWSETGFEALCAEEDVPLVSLEQEGSVLCERDGFSFHIARTVMGADVVVNMPKVKTHILTTLTAAVKNLYGTLPGYQKAHMHRDHATVPEFAGLLRAIHDTIPPALNIADGIVGMQGDGPSGGTPVALGFLAASDNAYALDQVICRILGLPLRSVPYLPTEFRAEVIGTALEDILVQNFKRPSTLAARLVPKWLAHLLAPFIWIRPAVTDACVFCGQCVDACPVDALSMTPRQKPQLAAGLCIGCCCCHEICPQNAISMAQSPLLNLVRKGKLP